MNSKPIMALLAFLIVLMLTGCSNAQMPSTPTAAKILPSLTPAPTIASTPIPTPSSTPTPLRKPSRACITVDKTNKAGIAILGILVFDNLSPDLDETVFLRNVEKSNIKTLPTPGPIRRFWGVSPDRKKLLFDYDSLTTDEYRVVVADSNGKAIVDFDNQFNEDHWNYYNWQNDENIRTVKLDVENDKFKTFPGLYNPFENQYKVLRTDWPDAYVNDGLDWKLDWMAISTMHYAGSNIVYDPTLTRVVYPKNGEIVSLTDVETGKELASIHLRQWGKLPRWSPDGKKLALVARAKTGPTKALDEFFIVSRDGGEFKQLTYLTNVFDQVAISEYAWSPDGKQIAFLLNTDPGNPNAEGTQSELAILNVDTGEITDLCFQTISAVTHIGGPVLFVSLQPVWSPDGTQIMAAQWDADSSEKKRKYSDWIIDIPSLIAVKVDENKQPTGWMTEVQP